MAYRFNNKDKAEIGKVRGAANFLERRIEDLQLDWDDSTERWQESERGQAVQEWLYDMENQARALGDLADEIEDSEPDV